MKKLTMLIAGGILSAALQVMAEREYANGYVWEYNTDWRGGVSIGNRSWSSRGSSSVVSPKPTGLVTIPSRLGGKPVTCIGSGAFYGYSEMTGVTIPDSVTRIEDNAFD